MSKLVVNGRPAYGGEMRIPRAGAWEGDFTVPREGEEVLEGPVVVEVGALSWRGTAWRSGENMGAIHLRAVGGAGGLSRSLEPRAYRDVPARIPLSNILGETGEALSPATDAGLLDTRLPMWNRPAQPGGTALQALVLALGRSVLWRTMQDGTIWIGVESWPASALASYQYLQQAPSAGMLDLIAEDPTIFPGEVFLDRRVSAVIHRVLAGNVRTRILFEEEEPADRLKAHVLAVIRAAFPRLPFLVGYGCKVVAQNGDRTLELQPDDPTMPGLSKVPIRPGLAGTAVDVPAGSRVLLEFDGGDPAKPYASVWESADPTTIELGVGNLHPAALGDRVRTELDAIWDKLTALGTHSHPYTDDGNPAVTGTPSSGPVTKAAQDIQSSVVKVKD